MGICLVPDDQIKCRVCGRKKREDEHLCGKRMWHHRQPTCRHEEFFNCPECYTKDKAGCSVCGRQEEYT